MAIRIQTKPDVTYRGLQLEKKDIHAFRVSNLIRGAWDDKFGGFEREICEAEQSHRETQTRSERRFHDAHTIPPCIFRSITSQPDAAGGYIVEENNVPRAFADFLYAESVILPRATVLEDMRGPLSVGIGSTGITVAWGAEEGTVAPSEPTFGQKALSPKELSVMTPISKFLIQQSDPTAENAVRESMMGAFAQEFDSKILYGTGASNQISGLNQLGRIKTSPNPGRISYDADAEIERTPFANALKIIGKANASSMLDWLIGWDLYATMQAKYGIFEDQRLVGISEMGTSIVNATEAWLGNWKYLVAAIWGGMDISVDTTSLAHQGQVRVVGHYRVDAGALHDTAFVQIKPA